MGEGGGGGATAGEVLAADEAGVDGGAGEGYGAGFELVEVEEGARDCV